MLRRRLGAAVLAALIGASCDRRNSAARDGCVIGAVGASGAATAASAAGAERRSARGPFGHVFIVAVENANYGDVIGDSSMPYLNSLARQYGLATQYYANTHPSIGNYFMMTVGDTITNDDGYSGIVSEDNVVRALVAGGKTWKSYAEDLPCVGYTGPGVDRYARKHNVFGLLADVVHDTAQVKNLVPFAQLATDLAADTLPHYGFIVPNLCHDAHDCPLRTADDWLKQHIDPLVRSAAFQRDGLLIIVFDESRADNTHGGGRIACVIV